MPEKRISFSEHERIIAWVSTQNSEQLDVDEDTLSYLVNEEPLSIVCNYAWRLRRQPLKRWRFELVRGGAGFLSCSERHAEELELAGVISFSSRRAGVNDAVRERMIGTV